LRALFICGLLASASLATTVGAAEAPKVKHDPLTCAPGNGNARVRIDIATVTPLESARVYFHAVNKQGEYYMEMRRGEAGSHWAVLPIPLSDTKNIEYRIVVKTADGLETAVEPITIPVTSDCSVLLTDDEGRFARNLVIGQTLPNQSTVPPGFECKGIISEINVAGELRPNDECRKVPVPFWAAAAGAAALGGGAVIVSNTGGGGPGVPVSPSRPTVRSAGN
jgi:hypothetical protein